MSTQEQANHSLRNSQNDENVKTVTIKKTIKKTRNVKKSKNPKITQKTIKSSVWNGDSFDNELNDEEYIEQRKRDKILKMIKNAHIEKTKNYIFLKEINNAHDQIQRFSQMGETA